MSPILIAAATIISLALVAYTIGVFGERNSGTLKRSHLIFFWIGLACDSTGTAIMSSMVQSSGGSISLLHPVTGGLAIALMLFRATWATYVLLRGNSKQRHNFHRLSICVWLIWLVPYCTGVLVGIPALHVADSTALAIASAIVIIIAAVIVATCCTLGFIVTILGEVGLSLLVGLLTNNAANDGSASHTHDGADVATAWAVANAANGRT